MVEPYKLEKWEWTSDDFDVMGWHDCPIYAIRFDDNIYFDIDYIFKWNNHGAGQPFTFWMAPVTLVFELPESFKMNIEGDFINGLEIADILKETGSDANYVWTIVTQEGDIVIKAQSYKQIIKRPPSHQYNLFIPEDERGGFSFSLIPEQDYSPDDDIASRISERERLHQLSKERREYKKEKSSLDQIPDLKLRLARKAELESAINALNAQLLGTIFEDR